MKAASTSNNLEPVVKKYGKTGIQGGLLIRDELPGKIVLEEDPDFPEEDYIEQL